MHPDLFLSLFTGIRFDLLILGFIWIPLIVGIWILPILVSARGTFWLAKIYLMGTSIVILYDSMIDFAWFQIFSHRLKGELSMPISDLLKQAASAHSWAWLMGVYLLMALPCSWLILKIIQRKLKTQKKSENPFLVIAKILASILLVALAARGTLTPHHLAKEHSEISTQPLLNNLALNAPYQSAQR